MLHAEEAAVPSLGSRLDHIRVNTPLWMSISIRRPGSPNSIITLVGPYYDLHCVRDENSTDMQLEVFGEYSRIFRLVRLPDGRSRREMIRGDTPSERI